MTGLFASSSRALRVGVLHNPASRRNRTRLPAVLKVQAAYPQAPFYQVRTAAEVTAALAELARREVEVIVVNGGDGTVHAVLTGLLRGRFFAVQPRLAVLAGGTTNMTAADVGFPGDPARALGRLLACLRQDRDAVATITRPVMRVTLGPDGPPQYGLFFSAAGFYSATLARWESRAKARAPGMSGGLGTGLFVGRLALEFLLRRPVLQPSRIRMQLDQGALRPLNCLLLLVTTLERLALGLRPYWGEEPGALHCTTVAAAPRRLLRAAPALLRGQPNPWLQPEFGYASHNAERIRLHLDGGCLLDGEIVTNAAKQPIIISADNHVSFIRY